VRLISGVVRLLEMLKHLKSKKFTIPIVAFLLLGGIFFYFSDRFRLLIFIKTNYSKTRTPEMYLIPIKREVQLSNQLIGIDSVLSHKNIQFAVPWELREKLDYDVSTLFVFVNTKGIAIDELSKDESIIQKLLKEEFSEVQKTKLLFGEEDLKSEYAIVNLILHTTPGQASLLNPINENAKIVPLLMWKSLYTVYGNVIYQFSLNNFKCFQFGNPEKTENIRIHIFNDKNQVYRLHFVKATQAEIDHIISSIEFR